MKRLGASVNDSDGQKTIWALSSRLGCLLWPRELLLQHIILLLQPIELLVQLIQLLLWPIELLFQLKKLLL